MDKDSVRVRLEDGHVISVELRDRLQSSVPDARVEELRQRVKALEARQRELTDERWLLIASPVAKAVAIVDLEEADKPVYVRDLHDTHALDRVFWSQDRQHIVQLNTNGRFFISTGCIEIT